MNLSDQIPFSCFTDELGEGFALNDESLYNGEPLKAILNYRDTVSPTGRQYQSLELEIDSTIEIKQGDKITLLHRDNEIFHVSEVKRGTYTGSKKYVVNDLKTKYKP